MIREGVVWAPTSFLSALNRVPSQVSATFLSNWDAPFERGINLSSDSRTLSLEDLRDLIGPLKDDAPTQEKFRNFIQKQKWELLNYQNWCREAVEKKYSEEFQDLVTVLGKLLGFEIEFGLYQSKSGKVAYDGLWKTDSGMHIVLEAKIGTWIAHNIGQLGGYLEHIAHERGIDSSRIYGLYVVGDSSMATALCDQIRGSKWREQIRMISYDDLLKLVELKTQLDSMEIEDAEKKAQAILIPIDNVDVGNLVDLVAEIAEYSRVASTEEEEQAVAIAHMPAPWTLEAIRSFIKDSTRNQKCLLSILSKVESINRHTLVEQMREATKDDEFDGLKLAGTRAGLAMRQKRDGWMPLILTTERGKQYQLAPEFRKDIERALKELHES